MPENEDRSCPERSQPDSPVYTEGHRETRYDLLTIADAEIKLLRILAQAVVDHLQKTQT